MTFAKITPGTTTLYRVWLNDRIVCHTDNGSTASWAHQEANRHRARYLKEKAR